MSLADLCVKRRWAGWLWQAVWLVTFWPGLAVAQDRIVERMWQLDPSGQLTVAEVASGRWQAAPAILSLGYRPDTLWMRLKVRVTRPGETLVLRTRPSYLDHIRLYLPDPQHPGRWQTRDTGDTLPFATRDRASAALALVWEAPQTGDHVLYMQVRTTSTLMLHVQALDPREAQFHDARLDRVLMFHLSIMLCMGLWAWLDYTLNRHVVNLWFMAAQLNAVVFALSLQGYMAALLPHEWSVAANEFTSVSVCLSTMLALGFYRAALMDNQPSATSRHAVTLVMLLFPVQLMLMWLEETRWAVQSNAMVALLLALPLLVWMVSSSRRDGLLTRRAWWVACGAHALLTAYAMLPVLGWRSADDANLQTSLFFGLSSAMLMLAVLVTHSRRARVAAREDRLRLSLLTQRLTLEQQQRADLQQFLDMLGHELKTPLMTIRLASNALRRGTTGSDDGKVLQRIARIEASVEAMNQVLERVMEANRLGDYSLPINVQGFAIGALLEAVHDAMAEPERLHRHGDTMLQVRTDPDLLRVIVSNLLDNACKYSPPESPVSVAVQSDARSWCLTVRNQLGPTGVPDPDRVFRKYHRAEEAKGLPGAGLGLWLGHNLAQHLGGSLEVRTVKEHVEFSLCLPLTASP